MTSKSSSVCVTIARQCLLRTLINFEFENARTIRSSKLSLTYQTRSSSTLRTGQSPDGIKDLSSQKAHTVQPFGDSIDTSRLSQLPMSNQNESAPCKILGPSSDTTRDLDQPTEELSMGTLPATLVAYSSDIDNKSTTPESLPQSIRTQASLAHKPPYRSRKFASGAPLFPLGSESDSHVIRKERAPKFASKNISSRRGTRGYPEIARAKTPIAVRTQAGGDHRHHPREPWQIQKSALLEKFGSSGWSPRKRLSPDAVEGIRALHAKYPNKYPTAVLADQFEISPEAVRRILKSKWRANEEETVDRRQRWDKRGAAIWGQMVEIGIKPPKKWRDMGVSRSKDRRVTGGRQAESKDGAWRTINTFGAGMEPDSGETLSDRIL